MGPTLNELSPLLIANRGEIAVRVARTAHDLGLETVAVFTEADRGALHTGTADLAIRIGSYLEPADLIDAARRSGARAIHPGYGFLSENAGFAAAVTDAGLTWVGPPPAAIELMGDKGRAKQLAREAGVPTVPGTGGEEAGEAEIAALAAEHGYPIVIKALAGGGGKGMRVVRDAGELDAALGAARREAEAAFGDGRVLAERYLERPRHVEIQVLADAHGAAVHLGERECSLQRRHQKVVEEAPSPIVDPAMREAMGAAAVELSRACGYAGAGTVEFIVPSDGSGFHFLEMNTRLQVEHPVTELVWGVDLVEQQLRIAAGEPLPLSQGELVPEGHAIEVRVYAEDPAAGFLPAVGAVLRLALPEADWLRFDTGIAEGSRIGTHFDPMLAKLIVHGPDRSVALARLDRALAGLELLGVSHNAGFCRRLMARDEVRAGELDTGLLERALEGEALETAAPDDLATAAAFALWLDDTEGATVAPGPWRRRLTGLGEIVIGPDFVELDAGNRIESRARRAGHGRIAVELDGIERRYAVAREGDAVWIGRAGFAQRFEPTRSRHGDADSHAGSLEAPMPGKVLSLAAADGDAVEAGDLILVLESMKMELQMTAPFAGTVAALSLSEGEQVSQGQVLAEVHPAEEES